MKLLSRKKTGGIIKLLNGNELPPGTYGALDNPIRLPEYEYIQNDLTNWYLPFDPRVYKGGTGTPSKEAQNNVAMWRKAKSYYDEFVKYGIDPYVALGIMGNMAMESSFDPNAYSGYYRGLILNEPDIVNYIVKNYGGYDRNHLMQFIIDGLKGRIKGDISQGYGYDLQKRFLKFLKAVRNSKDVVHIAGMWDDLYERSNGKTRKRRLNFASYFALLLGL